MIACALSAFGGGLIGGCVACLVGPSEPRSAANPYPSWLDDDVAEQIEEAAQEWATAHGRPGAAELVARKLRLAHRLGRQRRERRPWRR